MSHKLSQIEFIGKALATHGECYDYSQVNYVNNSTKVKIICPSHGVFEQRPSDHQRGQGCHVCGRTRQIKNLTKTTESFVERANIIHQQQYLYDNVIYTNVHKHVLITCIKHGVFNCTPASHLNGIGCPECKKEKISLANRMSQPEFISKSKAIHDLTYDYSNVIYKNNHTVVDIICAIHGVFKQRPDVHLRGSGCSSCSTILRKPNIGCYSQEFFNSNPNLKEAQSLLYLIHLVNARENIVKIGVTVNPSVYDRFKCKHTFYGYKFNIIKTINMPLQEAFEREQHIKKVFHHHQKFPSKKFNGFTECFAWSPKLEVDIIQTMEQ
jgi:hypothetical protein